MSLWLNIVPLYVCMYVGYYRATISFIGICCPTLGVFCTQSVGHSDTTPHVCPITGAVDASSYGSSWRGVESRPLPTITKVMYRPIKEEEIWLLVHF